jgi:hypothetical protein
LSNLGRLSAGSRQNGRQQAECDASWNNWLDTRLDERLGDERDFMIEAVDTALGEAMADLRDEMDQHRKEVREALSDEEALFRRQIASICSVFETLRVLGPTSAPLKL